MTCPACLVGLDPSHSHVRTRVFVLCDDKHQPDHPRGMRPEDCATCSQDSLIWRRPALPKCSTCTHTTANHISTGCIVLTNEGRCYCQDHGPHT